MAGLTKKLSLAEVCGREVTGKQREMMKPQPVGMRQWGWGQRRRRWNPHLVIDWTWEVTGWEESSNARCHCPPWGMQERRPARSVTYQPPLHSCIQVPTQPLLRYRLAQPMGILLTQLQFCMHNPPAAHRPAHLHVFCSPQGGISGPPVPRSQGLGCFSSYGPGHPKPKPISR